MPVAESPFLVPWANFYILLGSSAAAMTGLMFIVITLIAGIEAVRRAPVDGIAVFSTPTVAHLCVALLGSAILSAPSALPGRCRLVALLGLAGICGIVYVVNVLVRMSRWTSYRPVLEDWVWYGILPLIRM